MIHYILQTIAFQLLFLLVYDVFLKRETFYTANRWYLLLTPLASLLLPLIQIEAIREQIPAEYMITLPAVIVGTSNASLEPTTTALAEATQQFSWSSVWAAGSVVALLILGFKVMRLRRMINSGSIQTYKDITYVELPQSNAAFTFFRRIYLGTEVEETQKEAILQHEQVHVAQGHSWDLLYFEGLRILFWFNPFVYLFQHRVGVLHEYTADDHVAKAHGVSHYYQELLSQVFQTRNFSFINTFFNHSLIKKRILMLRKNKSKNIVQLKYLVVLPLIAGMLVYTACSQERASEVPSEISEKIADLQQTLEAKGELSEAEVQQLKALNLRAAEMSSEIDGIKNSPLFTSEELHTEAVPFATIDKTPLYPGCENLDQDAAKKCMTQKISNLVVENFNTEVMKGNGLVGQQRIVVQFKIDTAGNILDVKARAPQPELETEALRVINMLPQMTPGEHRGKKVSVMYSLPIIFSMDE